MFSHQIQTVARGDQASQPRNLFEQLLHNPGSLFGNLLEIVQGQENPILLQDCGNLRHRIVRVRSLRRDGV